MHYIKPQLSLNFFTAFSLLEIMFAMEEVLSELSGEEVNEQGLPPGFRFHPTDEELITFYLASKVFNGAFCGVEIAEVDLNRCEPWELPDVAKMGEKEWYFFSLRDRKYPTGLRTNRATGAGYWKATGKDREVCSGSNGALLGMKKTLVFYRGRAPRGEKTKWVMHEYRLDGDFSYRHTCKEEWVICRIFHKAGEKKSGFLQGQGYLLEANSSPTGGCLSPLLECQSQNQNPMDNNLQNQFVIQQTENDLKGNSLISFQSYHHHHLFPINGLFQTSTIISTMANANNTSTSQSESQSMLFKSLLSHQDFTLKEQITSENTIPKHCKTEANFSHFQLPDSAAAAADSSSSNNNNNNHNFSTNCWMDKIQPSPCQNPFFFEIDCSFPGITQGFTTTAATGTSVHDLSTSVAFNRTGFQVMFGESWPLDA